MSEFDSQGFGDTFWAYGEQLEDASFFQVLNKPYPMNTSGELISYSYNIEKGDFFCKWKGSAAINAPTKLYIPNLEQLDKENIRISPEVESIEIINIDNSMAGQIIIPSGNESIIHEVYLKFIVDTDASISLLE